MNNEELILDKELVWHPFTQSHKEQNPIYIKEASGSYFYDNNGKSYIDAVSSWWVNLHGHSHPHISNTIKSQLDKMHQVIFAGCTHDPAITLCKRLAKIVPIPSPHFFFSDNGSTAVEVALKTGVQYVKQTGQAQKKRFLYLEDAYHGDTFGAMSVSERGFFTEPFTEFMFNATSIPNPSRHPEETLKLLKQECEKNDVIGLIYEPLVQGASGMQFYAPEVLEEMISICKNHSVLCIADEVFTGFGRTGKLFASDYSSHKPDMICLSKALTGGTLPMGLTVSSENIWQAFQSDKKEHMLLHGHSFTGNPLSCSAALASLDLVEKEDFQTSIKRISDFYLEKEKEVLKWEKVESVRHIGIIFALNIKDSVQGYTSSIRDTLYPYFLEHGVHLRPLGNVIYIVPPVCITNTELEIVFQTIQNGLKIL